MAKVLPKNYTYTNFSFWSAVNFCKNIWVCLEKPFNLFVTSKNENSNSPILQFTNNWKYCKMSFKAFEMIWHVFKVINKKYYTINKGFLKALMPLCSILNSWIGDMENSCFRFLMSRTGYFLGAFSKFILSELALASYQPIWL